MRTDLGEYPKFALDCSLSKANFFLDVLEHSLCAHLCRLRLVELHPEDSEPVSQGLILQLFVVKISLGPIS